MPRSFEISVLDLALGYERTLLAAANTVLGVAWAPDGSQLAYAQVVNVPDDPAGGAQLHLFDGVNSRVVVSKLHRGQVLSRPAWTPDGRALVYETLGPNGVPTIERAALDGTERSTLERAAAAPAVSPDGTLLAFVRTSTAEAIAVRDLTNGSGRELVPADVFVRITSLRFSPDGHQLAFVGSGGPTEGELPAPANSLRLPSLGVPRALAHGPPWEPWVVNLDGTGLRRVASVAEDEPTLAWSPDGTTLALLGGSGLWLVPLHGAPPIVISRYGGSGDIDWRH